MWSVWCYKMFFCAKFDMTCASCKFRRCIACVKFFNAINFFFKNSTNDQWNCICNFLDDIFRLHSKTREYFKDVFTPIRSSIRDTCFIISDDSKVDNGIMNDRKKRYIYIYYVSGHKKYKFYFNVV